MRRMRRAGTVVRGRLRRRGRDAFTLIELMIVVAIIGILSIVAMPAFNGYLQRSRALEGFNFLADIRARQASYRSEWGRYCGPLAWNPASYAPPSSVVFFNPATPGWSELGARPDGAVRFRYQVQVGVPGTVPAGIANFPNNDFWYVAHAEADLDGDGQTIAIEAYSPQRQVYVSRGVGGPYLAEGWE